MKRALISTFSKALPGLTASFAYRQLTNPQVKKLRERESLVLNKAKKDQLHFKGFDIQCYVWGEGDKSVLLIHGWEGQAGNFADLVEKLLANHYKIYAFDGPSHGHSSRGKTSLFEFTELVAVMIKKFEVRMLISHSFGGVATSYALFANPELQIDKYLLLTTPDRFSERIDDVSKALGITDEVKERLINRLEKETGQRVADLNVSDFVKQVNVKQALIIHDKNDKVIPIERAMNVYKNWPAAGFSTLEGTWHFRILRDPAVLNLALKFLSN